MRDEKFLVIGQILKPWGVRGEVKVQILSDFTNRFKVLQTVYLGEPARAIHLESARLHSGAALFKFAGCDTPEAAAKLRGEFVSIATDDATPLEKGQYYHHQVVGLQVETEEGRELGTVSEILETGANDVYVVTTPDTRDILLPAIKSVVKKIDLDAHKMIVRLIPGLLE